MLKHNRFVIIYKYLLVFYLTIDKRFYMTTLLLFWPFLILKLNILCSEDFFDIELF